MEKYFYIIRPSRGSNRLAVREMAESAANLVNFVAGPFCCWEDASKAYHRLKNAEFMCTELGAD